MGHEQGVTSPDRAGNPAVTGQPVLEVGGTHARASRVDTTTWQPVPGSACRLPLDSSGPSAAIIATMVQCADALCLTSAETLAVAIPDPFDYETGIARFEGVGKFDGLAGVDLRRTLLAQLAQPPGRVTFANDADAFGLGEWLAGSGRGYQRVVAITLGTGVGSAFVDAGRIISSGPSVPPDGHVYRLMVRGRPLEETVSRRAIIAEYQRLSVSRNPDWDVREIAEAALSGDPVTTRIFAWAFRLLGEALAPWLTRFRAQVLAVGGGVSTSWALILGPLQTGLGEAASGLVVVRSANTEDAIAAGAAWHSDRSLAPAGPSVCDA
jgi:glucokinase